MAAGSAIDKDGEEVKRNVAADKGETVILEQRCQLFKYNTSIKEWEGIGVGPARVLQSDDTKLVRLVIREAKNGYIRANHYVHPDTELKVFPNAEHAYTFTTAEDASIPGQAPQPAIFTARFKTAEIGAQFKTAFEWAQKVNKAVSSGSDIPTVPEGLGGVGGGSVGAAGGSGGAAGGGSDAIPEAGSAAEVYGEDGEAMASRLSGLKAAYEAKYGSAPICIARAPGRVNVIGEHIDYHLYPVMPFALKTQDVLIAVGKAEGECTVENVSDGFEAKSFAADPKQDVVTENDQEGFLGWARYVVAGYKGAYDAASGAEPQALHFLVDGSVPVAAGVSSSSALVVASVLATSKAIGQNFTRGQLAGAAWQCESYVGTLGGGMDQAISSSGERDKVGFVEFNPMPDTSVVPFPKDAAFVVANSCVSSEKAADAHMRYNRRVIEGQMAAKLIAKALNDDRWNTDEIATISDIQHKVLKASSPSALLEAISTHLPAEPQSLKDLETLFGKPLREIFSDGGKAHKREIAEPVFRTLEEKPEEKLLCLAMRARHVASEAQRVFDFKALCDGEHTDGTLTSLGELMNASHTSCKDDYECSHEALDQLVQIARDAGALGARLTGAGWGGCIVALTTKDKADTIRKALEENFYAPKALDADTLKQSLFLTSPGAGATVIRI